MVTLAACAQLQHQQAKLVLKTQNLLLDLLHLRLRNVVNVHAHGGAHACGALERAIVVGQARVVHLHQSALQLCVALAYCSHVLHLVAAVAQHQVFGSREDGAHHLRPILVIYNVYAHRVI